MLATAKTIQPITTRVWTVPATLRDLPTARDLLALNLADYRINRIYQLLTHAQCHPKNIEGLLREAVHQYLPIVYRCRVLQSMSGWEQTHPDRIALHSHRSLPDLMPLTSDLAIHREQRVKVSILRPLNKALFKRCFSRKLGDIIPAEITRQAPLLGIPGYEHVTQITKRQGGGGSGNYRDQYKRQQVATAAAITQADIDNADSKRMWNDDDENENGDAANEVVALPAVEMKKEEEEEEEEKEEEKKDGGDEEDDEDVKQMSKRQRKKRRRQLGAEQKKSQQVSMDKNDDSDADEDKTRAGGGGKNKKQLELNNRSNGGVALEDPQTRRDAIDSSPITAATRNDITALFFDAKACKKDGDIWQRAIVLSKYPAELYVPEANNIMDIIRRLVITSLLGTYPHANFHPDFEQSYEIMRAFDYEFDYRAFHLQMNSHTELIFFAMKECMTFLISNDVSLYACARESCNWDELATILFACCDQHLRRHAASNISAAHTEISRDSRALYAIELSNKPGCRRSWEEQLTYIERVVKKDLLDFVLELLRRHCPPIVRQAEKEQLQRWFPDSSRQLMSALIIRSDTSRVQDLFWILATMGLHRSLGTLQRIVDGRSNKYTDSELLPYISTMSPYGWLACWNLLYMLKSYLQVAVFPVNQDWFHKQQRGLRLRLGLRPTEPVPEQHCYFLYCPDCKRMRTLVQPLPPTWLELQTCVSGISISKNPLLPMFIGYLVTTPDLQSGEDGAEQRLLDRFLASVNRFAIDGRCRFSLEQKHVATDVLPDGTVRLYCWPVRDTKRTKRDGGPYRRHHRTMLRRIQAFGNVITFYGGHNLVHGSTACVLCTGCGIPVHFDINRCHGTDYFCRKCLLFEWLCYQLRHGVPEMVRYISHTARLFKVHPLQLWASWSMSGTLEACPPLALPDYETRSTLGPDAWVTPPTDPATIKRIRTHKQGTCFVMRPDRVTYARSLKITWFCALRSCAKIVAAVRATLSPSTASSAQTTTTAATTTATTTTSITIPCSYVDLGSLETKAAQALVDQAAEVERARQLRELNARVKQTLDAGPLYYVLPFLTTRMHWYCSYCSNMIFVERPWFLYPVKNGYGVVLCGKHNCALLKTIDTTKLTCGDIVRICYAAAQRRIKTVKRMTKRLTAVVLPPTSSSSSSQSSTTKTRAVAAEVRKPKPRRRQDRPLECVMCHKPHTARRNMVVLPPRVERKWATNAVLGCIFCQGACEISFKQKLHSKLVNRKFNKLSMELCKETSILYGEEVLPDEIKTVIIPYLRILRPAFHQNGRHTLNFIMPTNPTKAETKAANKLLQLNKTIAALSTTPTPTMTATTTQPPSTDTAPATTTKTPKPLATTIAAVRRRLKVRLKTNKRSKTRHARLRGRSLILSTGEPSVEREFCK